MTRQGLFLACLALLLAAPACQAASPAAPLSTATPVAATPTAPSTLTSPVDGMVLVMVPAGDFIMGSSAADLAADSDEKPQHTVSLDAFWIDRTLVTNGLYGACVAAGKCTAPSHSGHFGQAVFDQHPVLGVAWDQAVDYCTWAGRRLPTEAEWEKAARGTDGRLYPWGNQPPDATRLNFNHLVNDTTAVGQYPAGASPYGALDMAGNLWEWVADGYDPEYYAHSPAKNPTGGPSVNQRVLRGGNWESGAHSVRTAARFWAFPHRNDTDGFRCARSS